MCDILSIKFGIGCKVKSDEFGIGIICSEKDVYKSYMVEFSTQNEKLHRNGSGRRCPKTFYNYTKSEILKLIKNYEKQFEKYKNKRIVLPHIGFGTITDDFSNGHLLVKIEGTDFVTRMSFSVADYLIKQGGDL